MFLFKPWHSMACMGPCGHRPVIISGELRIADPRRTSQLGICRISSRHKNPKQKDRKIQCWIDCDPQAQVMLKLLANQGHYLCTYRQASTSLWAKRRCLNQRSFTVKSSLQSEEDSPDVRDLAKMAQLSVTDEEVCMLNVT